MSVRIMSEVFERSKTQGNARLVLLSLADSCNDDASCWPSIRKLSEKANISEPITKKYLNALIQIGVVTRDEREDFSGRQTSNLYTINVEKIGHDEISRDVIHQVTSPSRLKTFKGITAVSVEEANPDEMGVGVTEVSLPIMNHHKEPSIESSAETSAMASDSSNEFTEPNLFQTYPDEAHASGSATAELKSADGKKTTPRSEAPPRSKRARVTKLVDDAFISELKRLNPNKDVEGETQKARTWVIAHPPRQFSRAFLANWINRATATQPERFSNF